VDVFRLLGSYSTQPAEPGSGLPGAEASIDEIVSLAKAPLVAEYSLTGDSPVSVSLGGLSNVGVLVIKATGGKVRARLTSADGSQQAVPVDSLLILTSLTVPITAIDLTRVAGISTVARVTLGERG
jgi:hypothetical protein